MDEKIVYGIQQVGVGVEDVTEAFKWYATKLGADISVFDDDNTATHMARYMGGKPRPKRAIMAVNLQGGSGYEIWQHTEHTPRPPAQPLQVGDLGINIVKIKTRDASHAHTSLQKNGVKMLSEVVTDPDGKSSFYIEDPYGNILQVKESNSWHRDKKFPVGGVFGAVLGVSDIDESKKLYINTLGYDKIIYDVEGEFEDLSSVRGGKATLRRMLLTHSQKRTGGFARLFGESQIELIQVKSRQPVKIFENRYWGDLGYIHLCFDVRNINAFVEDCAKNGYPFTVRSEESFDMGDANGSWGYIEDPDGTLIEFVEALKVPILKKIGWSINMKKRDPHKPMPKWLINAMSFNRVKF